MHLGDLEDPDSRYQCGASLLRSKSAGGQFTIGDMMAVLRDVPSGICRPGGAFPTAGSQVSLLGGSGNGGAALRSCHWFTATPSPARSVFKPFIFEVSPSVIMQRLSDTTCQGASRGTSPDNRQHRLWAEHALLSATSSSTFLSQLAALEAKYVELGLLKLKKGGGVNLFAEAVASELELYASMKSVT